MKEIFLALEILMGQVRKDKLPDYWSINFTIETPFFSETMFRNTLKLLLNFLHFSNNEEIKPGRLVEEIIPNIIS